MFNRKNAAFAATLLGGLFVAALLVALISRIDFRGEESHPLTPSRVEVMPETTPEFRRTHFTGPDGKNLKIEIAYRNEDYGYIFFRRDGTMREFLIVFPDGKTQRKHSYFDPTGKIITSGFEVRADGTKVWVTEALASGEIKTLTYWQNGTSVFSESLRGKDRIETRFYRADSTPWLRRVISTNEYNEIVYEEDVFAADGKLERSRRTEDGYAGTVSYYRTDGTVDFVQKFERNYNYGYYGYGGPGGEDGYQQSTPTISLKLVTVYGADGKTPTMELGFEYTKTVATWDSKGTKTIKYLTYDGSAVSRVEYVAPGGGTTTNNNPTGDELKLPSYDEAVYKVDMPKPVDVVSEWRKLEPASAPAPTAAPTTP